MKSNQEQGYSVAEAALILNIGTQAVSYHIKQGHIITTKKNKKEYLISEEEILRFQRERKGPGRGPKHCCICHIVIPSKSGNTCESDKCLLAWREKTNARIELSRIKKDVELVYCEICHRQFEWLGRHLKVKHDISSSQYLALYPDAKMQSDAMKEIRSKGSIMNAKRTNYDCIDPDNHLFEFLTGAMLGDGSIEQMKLNARYAEGGK